MIEAKFRKEIQDELTKKLVSKSYHEAIAEKQLRVVSLTNLEDVEFGDDRSMRFRATVVTAPEFELPDYKGIPLQLPDTKVTEAEVDAAVERLREQSADFVDVPGRGLEMEDFAVIDFEGTIDGKPIAELAPKASKNLHGGKKFWLHLAPENFLPRFVEQMVGQKPDETRTVQGGVSRRIFRSRSWPARPPNTSSPCMRSSNASCRRSMTLSPRSGCRRRRWPICGTRSSIRSSTKKGMNWSGPARRRWSSFCSERIQFELPPNLLKTRNAHALWPNWCSAIGSAACRMKRSRRRKKS